MPVSPWFRFSNPDFLHLETDLGTSLGRLNYGGYLYWFSVIGRTAEPHYAYELNGKSQVDSPGTVEQRTATSHEINSESANLKIASLTKDCDATTSKSTLERPHQPPPVTG